MTTPPPVAPRAPEAHPSTDRVRTIGIPAQGATLAAIEERARTLECSLGRAGLDLVEEALTAREAPASAAPPGKPRLSAGVLRAWQADGRADFLTRMIELGVVTQAAEVARQQTGWVE